MSDFARLRDLITEGHDYPEPYAPSRARAYETSDTYESHIDSDREISLSLSETDTRDDRRETAYRDVLGRAWASLVGRYTFSEKRELSEAQWAWIVAARGRLRQLSDADRVMEADADVRDLWINWRPGMGRPAMAVRLAVRLYDKACGDALGDES